MQSPYAKQVTKTRKTKRATFRSLFHNSSELKSTKFYKPNGNKEVLRRLKQLERG